MYSNKSPKKCNWTQQNGEDSLYSKYVDTFATDCGNEFIFDVGTPSNNGMTCCCYCGGELVERLVAAESEDNDG